MLQQDYEYCGFDLTNSFVIFDMKFIPSHSPSPVTAFEAEFYKLHTLALTKKVFTLDVPLMTTQTM